MPPLYVLLAYLGPTAPYARPSGSTILEADKYFVSEGHFVSEGQIVSEGHRVGRTFFLTNKISCHARNFFIYCSILIQICLFFPPGRKGSIGMLAVLI